MRSSAYSFGSSIIAGALFVASAGCVSSVRPAPGAGITAAPGALAPEVLPPSAPVPTVPPPLPPPSPPPTGPRLAWVNPARCLTSCAFAPTPELVRVNRLGELDARGRFQLVAETQAALLALLQAARAAGHELRLESAFRSYQDQARVFADIKEPGRAARPGHSEHQLGTVADLRLPTSAAIDWLAAHAPGFGFALSYPPGKQKLTGYRPEPWHLRFVGRELAAELHGKHLILEEYFRAQPGLGESGGCADCPLPASQAACGDATPEGSCRGTVLTWCYDGALATVDCAASEQTCGPVDGSAEHDCLPKLP
jgi:D-alanyl-D-alanine carboxypeptidase